MMIIQSPFYKQLKEEVRADVAKVAVETIHNLMHLVRELYPDDPATQEMLDIDAVMLQADVVVDNLTKGKTNV